MAHARCIMKAPRAPSPSGSAKGVDTTGSLASSVTVVPPISLHAPPPTHNPGGLLFCREAERRADPPQKNRRPDQESHVGLALAPHRSLPAGTEKAPRPGFHLEIPGSGGPSIKWKSLIRGSCPQADDCGAAAGARGCESPKAAPPSLPRPGARPQAVARRAPREGARAEAGATGMESRIPPQRTPAGSQMEGPPPASGGPDPAGSAVPPTPDRSSSLPGPCQASPCAGVSPHEPRSRASRSARKRADQAWPRPRARPLDAGLRRGPDEPPRRAGADGLRADSPPPD